MNPPVRSADVLRRIVRQLEHPIERVDVSGYFGPDRRRAQSLA